MLNDPEHIKMILEARDKHGLKPTPPSLAEYSPEAARLDSVVDAVHTLTYVVAKANGAKGSKPPKPQLRPASIVDDVGHKAKVEKSKKLADRFMRRTVE